MNQAAFRWCIPRTTGALLHGSFWYKTHPCSYLAWLCLDQIAPLACPNLGSAEDETFGKPRLQVHGWPKSMAGIYVRSSGRNEVWARMRPIGQIRFTHEFLGFLLLPLRGKVLTRQVIRSQEEFFPPSQL